MIEFSENEFNAILKSDDTLKTFTQEGLFLKGRKDLSKLVKVKVTDKNGHSVYRWVEHDKNKKKKKSKPKLDPIFLKLNKDYKLSRLPIDIPKEKVTINTDGSQGNWILKWNDPKTNKIVHSYSEKFLKENANKKWDKIENITTADINKIESNSNKFLSSSNPEKAESAAISIIIAKTGLRPGSQTGFNETQNRGVSTLAKKNIKINGDNIRFEFKGKSYKNNTATVTDKRLAQYLDDKIKNKSDDDFVFDVDISKARTIFQKEITVKGIRLKDMRTFTATQLARQILNNNDNPPPPLPTKDIKKTIQAKLKQVFKKVSKQLNNTPAMAKSSYVHPKVIEQWLDNIGLSERRVELLKAEIDVNLRNEDYDGDIDEYPLPDWWDFNL